MDKPNFVLVELMRKDHSNIGYIESRRRNIKNCGGGLGRPDRDAVEAYAEEHNEPDCINGGQGVLVNS